MEKMFKMTIPLFMRMKKLRGIPICISCGLPILVGYKFQRAKGRLVKYICEECSKKDVLVYQFPISRKSYKGNRRNDTGSRHPDKWIHKIQSYTSQ